MWSRTLAPARIEHVGVVEASTSRRFADAYTTHTWSPAGIVTPPTSTSTRACRNKPPTGALEPERLLDHVRPRASDPARTRACRSAIDGEVMHDVGEQVGRRLVSRDQELLEHSEHLGFARAVSPSSSALATSEMMSPVGSRPAVSELCCEVLGELLGRHQVTPRLLDAGGTVADGHHQVVATTS